MTQYVSGWVELPEPQWYEPGTPEWHEHGPRWVPALYLYPLLNGDFASTIDWATVNPVMNEGMPSDASERLVRAYEAEVREWAEAGMLLGTVSDPQWASCQQLGGIRVRDGKQGEDWRRLKQAPDVFSMRFGPELVRVIMWDKVVM